MRSSGTFWTGIFRKRKYKGRSKPSWIGAGTPRSSPMIRKRTGFYCASQQALRTSNPHLSLQLLGGEFGAMETTAWKTLSAVLLPGCLCVRGTLASTSYAQTGSACRLSSPLHKTGPLSRRVKSLCLTFIFHIQSLHSFFTFPHCTFTVTGGEAMPLAITCKSAKPVSVAAETSKVVEA